MSASRGARLTLGAEAALAFGAAIALFLLAAAIPIRGHLALILLLGGVYLYVVLEAARRLGPLYAVPLAIAGGLAFDSFYIPPTREFGASDWQNWLVVAIYILMGVLIGILGARSGRRAESANLARGVLASEQAALRRVATLVASEPSPGEVFAAVAEEVNRLLGVENTAVYRYEAEGTAAVVATGGEGDIGVPVGTRVTLEGQSVAARVLETEQPARIDDFANATGSIAALARNAGIRSAVGSPIIVEGRLWGAMVALSRQTEPLPKGTESRIAGFAQLVATTISNTEARAEVGRLAEEQAALRRIATLVARGASPTAAFDAVTAEAVRALDAERASLLRYEPDGAAIVVMARSAPDPDSAGLVPVGTRVTLEGENVVAAVLRTGLPARIGSSEGLSGSIAERSREMGVRASVSVPIIVEGRLWGTMHASWSEEDPGPDMEERMARFAELVGTAIANTEARREVATLADEQAALRRVATLVAEGVSPPELFAAVVRELGQLLGVDSTYLARYEPDDTVTGVGSWGPHGPNVPVGIRVPLGNTTVTGLVHESGRPARLEGYEQASGEIAEIVKDLGIRSAVGAPITVDGRPWGVMMAASNRPEPLPAGTEERIAAFTDLVATAISNAEARTETRRLADEQAALRRVATLAAEAVPSSDLFRGVAAEVGTLLGAELATLFRYEDEDTVRMLSIWTADGAGLETPQTWNVEELGLSRTTAADNWPGRVDDWTQFSGPLAHFVRDDAGVTSSVSSPIVVEGQLWGALAVHTTQDEQLPPDTEANLEEFTELVATAIANTQARSELSASRARIVVATDEERRRVVRDLHDGAQQRLVHTVVMLNMARTAMEEERADAADLVSEALQHAEEATGELRELAHGILPSVLTRGGLRAGVDALASRMPLPVEIGVSVERLTPEVEATAYFVVAEALTNVAKHSHADHAAVSAEVEKGDLRIEVRDDGVGGANPAGTGLIGLADRVSALDGSLRLESLADGGTLVAADIPVLPRA